MNVKPTHPELARLVNTGLTERQMATIRDYIKIIEAASQEGEMKPNENFHNSIADRNAAVYRMVDDGKSKEEIAAALRIPVSVVANFLGDDGMGGSD